MQEFYNCPNLFEQWLNRQWSIRFGRVRRDIPIQGSPERTLSRVVIEDEQKRLLLLEKFTKEKYPLRNQVARAVGFVNAGGLTQAAAFKRGRTGEYLPFFKNACFQLSDFYLSTVIERPQYLQSAEMGISFARFLLRLRKASEGIESVVPVIPFSIKTYIYQLFRQMRQYDPAVCDTFIPVLRFLEKEFMDIHDDLPVTFCHGDLHPLNVIWDGIRIVAVIDWEFAGFKPDIYDAANLMGCAGIENPEGLGHPMVLAFLAELQKNQFFSPLGQTFLVEYLIALRFAWLSEWLRKKDVQMIEMEADYLHLLMGNIDVLKQGWGIV